MVIERGRPQGAGRVPRLAVFLVAAFVLGVSLVLVTLGFRAGERAADDEAKPAVAGEAAAAPEEGEEGEEGGDDFTACTDCHGDLDGGVEDRAAKGLLYRHAKHFARGVSDCAMCHPGDTHEPDAINLPTMTRCFMCHGLTEEAMAPGECITCHPADFPDLPVSHQAAEWSERHGEVATADPFLCTSCHEQETCASCHGIDMPHPEKWKKKPHAEAFFTAGAQTCENCHARAPDAVDSCDDCHHPQQPRGVPWRAAHPSIVKAQGGRTCFDCHEPTTCATCHVQGREDFSADQLGLTTRRRGAAPDG